MKRISRDVQPDAAHDLLERVPRATIAFVDGGQLEATPVAYSSAGGDHWIGLPRGGAVALRADTQVTLVIDEGWYWFDLRAIRIRGTAAPAPRPPKGSAPALEWFRLAPARVTAWDYGTLREEDQNASR